MEKPRTDLSEMLHQPDALDQSVALNRITIQLLEERNRDFKRLRTILLISIIVNLLVIVASLYQQAALVRDYRDLLDSLEWEETTTTTTEVVQDTDGSGHNVLQVGDNGQIIYGESEGELNGTTDGKGHENNNQG